MNFNEFVNEVKDNIRLFLPKDYENAEVSTMECQKLNRKGEFFFILSQKETKKQKQKEIRKQIRGGNEE